MTLALAHRAAAVFNVNFYLAAATVIPVLFLAIAIQGQHYANMLKAAGAQLRQSSILSERYLVGERRAVWRALAHWVLAGIVVLMAFMLLFSAVDGEIEALVGLYTHGAISTPGEVLTDSVYLTLVAAAGPALLIGRPVIRLVRSINPDWDNPADTASPEPAPQTDKAGADLDEKPPNMRGG